MTQQVGGGNYMELNTMLQGPKGEDFKNIDLDHTVKLMQAKGFQIIDKKEEFKEDRFLDVGAVVYYLRMVSWQIQDFSVEKYEDRLKIIHNKCLDQGCFKVTKQRFFV